MAGNIFLKSAKTLGLHKMPLTHGIPFVNVARNIAAIPKAISSGLAGTRSSTALKKAYYKGSEFFGRNMREDMGEFVNLLQEKKGARSLSKWLHVTGASHQKVSNLERGTRAFGDSVADAFYRTSKYDYDPNKTVELVSDVLKAHGAQLKQNVAISRAGQVLTNSKAAAYNAMDQANMSKNMLSGPTLASNAAVLAIPTLTSTSITSATIKAMKRRSESAYHGYYSGRY